MCCDIYLHSIMKCNVIKTERIDICNRQYITWGFPEVYTTFAYLSDHIEGSQKTPNNNRIRTWTRRLTTGLVCGRGKQRHSIYWTFKFPLYWQDWAVTARVLQEQNRNYKTSKLHDIVLANELEYFRINSKNIDGWCSKRPNSVPNLVQYWNSTMPYEKSDPVTYHRTLGTQSDGTSEAITIVMANYMNVD